jgi:hypothetical protein
MRSEAINKMVLFKSLILILITIIGIETIHGQEYSFQKAQNHFLKGNYKEAIPILENLIVKYKKEVSYHYYLGRSYVATRQKMDKAIVYLQYAAAKSDFTNTYYYLAQAYLLNYNTNKAKTALEKYLLFASPSDKRKINHTLLLENIARIEAIEKNIPQYKVVYSQKLDNDFYLTLNSFIVDGQFEQIPDDLASSNKNSSPIYNLGFRSKNSFYFPVYNLRNRGTDIAKNLNSGESYSILSKNLDQGYNEILPYFHTASNTLYFSSESKHSIGGYDIFFSRFNTGSKTWSNPRPLKFPINTSSDDLIYIPVDDNTFLLVSNRQSDSYVLYKLSKTSANVSVENIVKLKEFECFHESSNELAATLNKHESTKKEISDRNNSASIMQEELLYQALQYQLKADSFLRQAERKRSLTRSNAGSLPKGIYKQIESDEVEAKRLQELADKNFQALSKTSKTAPRNEKEYAVSEMKTPTLHKSKSKKASEFKLLPKSPYSLQNPFPEHKQYKNGLQYKIQLGVFSQPADYNKFGGLSPVTKEFLQERNLTKYYCGKFYTYSEATRALRVVKQQGFSDAYIVSYYEGKKIPVSRAKEVEKQL